MIKSRYLWAALFVWSASVGAAEAAESTVKSLMRDKLERAHGLLDALALGDMGALQEHADRLRDISRVTTWHKSEVPDFLYYAKSFQNSAEYLSEQAKAKNFEGVAMGFVRVTLDCVQCHAQVRKAPGGKRP